MKALEKTSTNWEACRNSGLRWKIQTDFPVSISNSCLKFLNNREVSEPSWRPRVSHNSPPHQIFPHKCNVAYTDVSLLSRHWKVACAINALHHAGVHKCHRVMIYGFANNSWDFSAIRGWVCLISSSEYQKPEMLSYLVKYIHLLSSPLLLMKPNWKDRVRDKFRFVSLWKINSKTCIRITSVYKYKSHKLWSHLNVMNIIIFICKLTFFSTNQIQKQLH